MDDGECCSDMDFVKDTATPTRIYGNPDQDLRQLRPRFRFGVSTGAQCACRAAMLTDREPVFFSMASFVCTRPWCSISSRAVASCAYRSRTAAMSSAFSWRWLLLRSTSTSECELGVPSGWPEAGCRVSQSVSLSDPGVPGRTVSPSVCVRALLWHFASAPSALDGGERPGNGWAEGEGTSVRFVERGRRCGRSSGPDAGVSPCFSCWDGADTTAWAAKLAFRSSCCRPGMSRDFVAVVIRR